MKIKIAFFTLILLTVISCNQHKPTPVIPSDELKKDSFFPVTSFLKGQMALLDSTPITPLHIITINDKSDSAWIKREELHKFLEPFLTPVIAETNLTSYFKETSFNDLSLNAITFTYDAKKEIPDTIPLQHWDVYITPETGKVSKIYLVKKMHQDNKDFTQQLTWQVGKWAKIVTIESNKEKKEIVKEDKFTLDFNQ